MKKLYLLLILVFTFSIFQVQAADTDVLATIDGQKITEKQVMEKAVEQMMARMKKDKVYELQRGALDEIVDDMLLEMDAKKQGITKEQLIKNIDSKAAAVKEDDAKVFFEMQAKNRYKGQTFDQVKGQLIAQLTRQKKMIAYNSYMDKLRKEHKVVTLLERPRTKVSVDDDPFQGTKGAPITIVEFSEFQCPFCRKARPTIDKILNTYKGKVHYVFRDFPLSFHKEAKGAANAANCAGEQDKYWPYNTALWSNQKNLGPEGLKKIAEDLKLDMGKFNKCVESKKYFAEIDKDQAEGSRAGVSGTPAFFINGIFLSGAQPFDKFKEIIDEELKTKKAN